MKRTLATALICLALLLSSSASLRAEEQSPYGTYKRGTANSYGEKRPVTKAEDAKKVLDTFFKDKGLRVGKVKDKDLFFEADVLDREDRVIDTVIVNKRTGRIRSIY